MLNNFDAKTFKHVGFKVGTQAGIDTLLSKGTQANAIPGVFYLAGDTNRLYLGQIDKSIAAINQGVITVNNIKSLPNVGSDATERAAAAGNFYYAKEDNVLCIFNGKAWVQINPDTTLIDTSVELSASGDGFYTQYSNGSGDATTKTLDGDTIKFTGGNGVSVKLSKDTGKGVVSVAINGTVYGITASTVAENGGVKLQVGSSNVTLIPDAWKGRETEDIKFTTVGNEVKVAVNARHVADGTIEASPNYTGWKFGLADQDGTTLISGKHLDPVIAYGETNETSKFTNGTADLEIYSKKDIDTMIKTLNPMVYRGKMINSTDAGKKPNDYYIESTKPLAVGKGNDHAVKVSIGDTFMVEGNNVKLTDGGGYLNQRTLLIAKSTTGQEDASGYIKAGELEFDVVQSTTDEDTTYHFEHNATTNGGEIRLKDHLNETISTITLETQSPEDPIKLAVDTGANPHNNGKYTLSLGTITTSKKTNDTVNMETDPEAAIVQKKTVTAVTDVTTDKYGRVTGITKTPYLIEDSVVTIDTSKTGFTATDKTAGKAVTLKTSLALVDKNNAPVASAANSVDVSSETLNLQGSGNSMKIDLIWGTF